MLWSKVNRADITCMHRLSQFGTHCSLIVQGTPSKSTFSLPPSLSQGSCVPALHLYAPYSALRIDQSRLRSSIPTPRIWTIAKDLHLAMILTRTSIHMQHGNGHHLCLLTASASTQFAGYGVMKRVFMVENMQQASTSTRRPSISKARRMLRSQKCPLDPFVLRST